MPDYHGDIMYQVGKAYRPKDHTRLAIGLTLLMTLGMTGVHQFYLGNHKIGFFHLLLCLAMVFAAITLSFGLLLTLLGVQVLALLGEAVLMVLDES